MLDVPAVQNGERKADGDHVPAALAPPGEERVMNGLADHAGLYPRFRQVLSGAGGQEPPGDKVTALLARPEYSHPVNDSARARMLGDLQRDFGNAYVQRLAARTPAIAMPRILRQGDSTPGTGAVPHSSFAQPLDAATQAQMSSRFGHDFSGVRIHNDAPSQQAADSYNATAFTAGRDVYFNRGAYEPGSARGQSLLAHELAHVVQHDSGATAGATGVSEPGDPLEREADRMSGAALAGGPVPDPAGTGRAAVQRQATDAPPPPGGGGAPGAPPVSRPGDFTLTFAGLSFPLPLPDIVKQARAGKVSVPTALLRKLPSTPLKITDLTLDLDENKAPLGGTISAAANIPPIEGSGTLILDKDGNASGDVKAAFRSNKIPGLNDVEVSATVSRDKFLLETDVGFGYKNVTGSLHYKYDGRHSGKGKAHYEGAKLKGDIDVVLSDQGKASGDGKLEAELFKGLRGTADVAISEKGDIKVVGKIVFAQQIDLFPEKKYEKSFFNYSQKFPLWGFTIPVIDVNVGLFAEIHASAGFRAKFGPGVLRDIQITGEFGTDPEAVTQFGLSGEFFVPAGAEVVLALGGGIGLGLAVADITGGIEAQGIAGLYSALSVRPQFTYSGGKYTISGLAELAGVAQVKLGINASAKVDVGVWLFKGTVWRKDWTLAEWIWNTGLNVALRANVSYTLGEDFAPDFSFETGQVDPEKLVRDVMPESGSPVPAPPKPPVPDKALFNAGGASGGPSGAAPGAVPAPPVPGAPAAQTTPGQGPVPTAGAPADASSATPQLPDPPASLGVPPQTRDEEEDWQVYEYDVIKSNQSASPAGPPVMRAAKSTPGKRQLDAEFLDFSAKHPGMAISKTAFRQRFKKEYYDEHSKTWEKKEFRQEGGYEVPLDKDTGNDAPFLVPQSKLNSKINLTGRPPLKHYQDAATGGTLISKATDREDVRKLWNDQKKASPPAGYREAGSDGSDEQVDHIVELQVAGSNTFGNLQLLSQADNGSSGGTIRAFVEKQKANAAAAGTKGTPVIKWTKAIVGF